MDFGGHMDGKIHRYDARRGKGIIIAAPLSYDQNSTTDFN